MYLSTSGRKMRRYTVNPDGTLGAFSVFTEGVGMGDGQKTDKAGNVYSSSGAGPGIIRITSPDGKLLGTINLPIYGGEPKKQICATNEAFGGPDGRTLFIAGCVPSIRSSSRRPGSFRRTTSTSHWVGQSNVAGTGSPFRPRWTPSSGIAGFRPQGTGFSWWWRVRTASVRNIPHCVTMERGDATH
jgi:hypothetical protein